MIKEMLKVTKFFAEAHSSPQRYDDKPYIYHLLEVYKVGCRFIHLIPEDKKETVLIACIGHDTIEDARITYNDIKQMYGEEVAEIPAGTQFGEEIRLRHSGVRSIQSVTFLGGGDVGLITLVLVKPLAYHAVTEITAPAERDFAIDFPSMPRVYDDAYLNMICHPVGTLASTQIFGLAEFVWN